MKPEEIDYSLCFRSRDLQHYLKCCRTIWTGLYNIAFIFPTVLNHCRRRRLVVILTEAPSFWIKQQAPQCVTQWVLGWRTLKNSKQQKVVVAKSCWTAEERWKKCIDFATTARKWLLLLPGLWMCLTWTWSELIPITILLLPTLSQYITLPRL